MKIAQKHIMIDASFFFCAKRPLTLFLVINKYNHRTYERSFPSRFRARLAAFRRKIAIDNCYLFLSFSLHLTANNFVVRREKESERSKTRNTPRDIARERFTEKSSRRTSPGFNERRRRPMLFSPLRFLINPSLVG